MLHNDKDNFEQVILKVRVQDRAKEIRSLQDEVPKLKAQLAETKGIFKSKE